MLWRLLRGSRILSASDTQQLPPKEIPPPNPRARAHTPSARLSEAPGEGGGGVSTTHRRGRGPGPGRRPRVRRTARRDPGKDEHPGSGSECRCGGNWEETLRSGLFAREEGWEREKTRQIVAYLHCLGRRSSVLRKPQTYLFGSAEEEKGKGGGIPGKISDFSARLSGLQTVTFGDFAQARMDTHNKHKYTRNRRGIFTLFLFLVFRIHFSASLGLITAARVDKWKGRRREGTVHPHTN